MDVGGFARILVICSGFGRILADLGEICADLGGFIYFTILVILPDYNHVIYLTSDASDEVHEEKALKMKL